MRRVVILMIVLTVLTTETSFAFRSEPPGGQFTSQHYNATVEMTSDSVWNDHMTSLYTSENVATTFGKTNVDPVNTSSVYANVTWTTTADDTPTPLAEYPPLVAHCQLYPTDPGVHYKVDGIAVLEKYLMTAMAAII